MKTASNLLISRRFIGAVLAMLIGLGLAWFQLATTRSNALSEDVAAQVAGRVILKAELERAISGTNSARRQSLDPEQETQVLNRLIDENLLLQYGMDLGLAYDNPAVRKQLVQAVLGMVRANAATEVISDEDLERWYQDNKALFSAAGQRHVRYYRVSQNQLSEAELQANAEALRDSLLNGVVNPQHLQQWQADRVRYVPDSLLPASKLQDYLGKSLVSAAMALEQPGVTQPLAINNGLAILEVVDVSLEGEKAFESLKETVRRAWQRQQGEQALRALLADLRNDYEVLVNE